ncbi:MAG: Gfo/Idh/MocA family oxidoreductase, partial [Planctomycetes bacterium]|nr:Gfo/Idh/MocA family oxidoreductase [Planctomycetota bacterium]
MKNKQYGVLINGAGWVATQHVQAFMKNPHTNIVAISSLCLTDAQRLASQYDLKDVVCYDNLDKALTQDGVDIVSVCTPQHIHCENVLAAAAAGKHIAIEKPVANSLSELYAMRDAVNQAGVKTVVSFVLRWNPLFAHIKKLIADGALGEIYMVETDYQSYNGAWWGAWEEGRKIETACSAMAVAGCHAIDTLRWFAAEGETEAADPVEVFAYAGGKRKGKTHQYDPTKNTWQDYAPMEYDGLEVALVRFANGALGKVSVNFECIHPYTFPLEIFGDRGSIKNNRLWSHTLPEQKDWVEIPGICPDSSDVSHHPFQAQM